MYDSFIDILVIALIVIGIGIGVIVILYIRNKKDNKQTTTIQTPPAKTFIFPPCLGDGESYLVTTNPLLNLFSQIGFQFKLTTSLLNFINWGIKNNFFIINNGNSIYSYIIKKLFNINFIDSNKITTMINKSILFTKKTDIEQILSIMLGIKFINTNTKLDINDFLDSAIKNNILSWDKAGDYSKNTCLSMAEQQGKIIDPCNKTYGEIYKYNSDFNKKQKGVGLPNCVPVGLQTLNFKSPLICQDYCNSLDLTNKK